MGFRKDRRQNVVLGLVAKGEERLGDSIARCCSDHTKPTIPPLTASAPRRGRALAWTSQRKGCAKEEGKKSKRRRKHEKSGQEREGRGGGILWEVEAVEGKKSAGVWGACPALGLALCLLLRLHLAQREPALSPFPSPRALLLAFRPSLRPPSYFPPPPTTRRPDPSPRFVHPRPAFQHSANELRNTENAEREASPSATKHKLIHKDK